MRGTLVMIMAGGKGARLAPLTCHRAKPAVPFGGRYRIIDFVLSNLVNSGYRRIYVLTQYMASSLIHHILRNWQLSAVEGFIEISPAQMRRGDHWYRGTADSILQNLNLVADSRADCIAIFGGDHVYKCDVGQMEDFHRQVDADLTISACPVPRSEAHHFGVIQVDERGRVIGFQEKPENPTPIPGRPDTCLVSMGNYMFKAKVLVDALHGDDADQDSNHDFGKNIIPGLMTSGAAVWTYDFGANEIEGEPEAARPYWRDVGTLDSYIVANMDVRSRVPNLNLYNPRWRIRSAQRDHPPARFVHEEGHGAAGVLDSLVCEGCIVSDATVRKSLLGIDCFVHSRSVIDECLLTSGCDVGAGAHLFHVVTDKNCRIDPGAMLGYDRWADKGRFPFITPGGWIALPKGTRVPREGPIEFAHDMHEMLLGDPSAKAMLDAFEGEYAVGERGRHSYESAGPRYERYRPGH